MKIVSYAHWHGAGPTHTIENMLAKEIAEAYLHPVDLYGCRFNTCISSSSGTAFGPRGKKFELCPDCQKKIEEFSAEDIYKDFHREYERPGSFSDNDKQKWQSEYNATVAKVLEQSSRDAETQAAPSPRYLPAQAPEEQLSDGLAYKYYKLGKRYTNSMELFDLTPEKSGVTPIVSPDPVKGQGDYGLILEGYIETPSDGVYTFYLSTDNAARLFIDGAQYINNDKPRRPCTRNADIPMNAGLHTIKVTYIARKRKPILTLYYRGPETLGQSIPKHAFSHPAKK